MMHQFIQMLALVLLLIAAFVAWPRPQPWGHWHWSFGWAGMFFWLLSVLLVSFAK